MVAGPILGGGAATLNAIKKRTGTSIYVDQPSHTIRISSKNHDLDGQNVRQAEDIINTIIEFVLECKRLEIIFNERINEIECTSELLIYDEAVVADFNAVAKIKSIAIDTIAIYQNFLALRSAIWVDIRESVSTSPTHRIRSGISIRILVRCVQNI